MVISLILVAFIAIMHYVVIVIYTLVKIIELEKIKLKFMRSFTNQLIFEHSTGYAVIKRLNPLEITAHHFGVGAGPGSCSSETGSTSPREDSTQFLDRSVSAQFRRIQGTIKIVASNSSFLHSFRMISQKSGDLIQKIMQLPTTKAKVNQSNSPSANRNTFENLFTEFTSSLIMDSQEDEQRLDVSIELPAGLESQSAY